MAAGDSSTLICNLALTSLGEDPIVSLSDNRKAAILCNLHYDPARRELLRMQAWKFAKKQAQLPTATTAPLFTYAYAYPLPADFIRMYDEPDDDFPEYEIMGSVLMTNDDVPFNMLYVFDCQDATQFDPLFVQALAALLASKLAMPLAQSQNLEQAALSKVQNALDRASLVNSQEESAKEFDDDIWLRSRR